MGKSRGTKGGNRTPVQIFMDENHTKKKVGLFLGHTTEDSPDNVITLDEIDDMKYFKESLVDIPISPCESYISVNESSGFDPMKVQSSPGIIASFIALPLPMSLLSIPGIGVKQDRILKRNGIENTHQLIGQFLLFQGNKKTPEDIAKDFYNWLTKVGVNKERSTITAALAEKIGMSFPGVYDAGFYRPFTSTDNNAMHRVLL